MIIVHYNDNAILYYDTFISKIINYSDIAIEGFILLAGYMIGRNYLGKYINNSELINKKLLKKTINIIKIQYLLILTASLPVFLITRQIDINFHSIAFFLYNSIFFLNQVGLMHILPTFIPLFLFSIPILYLISNKKKLVVVLFSIALFAVGNYNPYIFNIGEKTIFPVILWQIYFIAGIFLGDKKFFTSNFFTKNFKTILTISLLFFSFTSVIKYGHLFNITSSLVKTTSFITVSKFPLNILGVMYYGSLLIICYCVIFICWENIKKLKRFNSYIILIGKNSLLAFVIHVYFCFLLEITDYYFKINIFFVFSFFLTNIIVSLIILFFIENKKYYYKMYLN